MALKDVTSTNLYLFYYYYYCSARTHCIRRYKLETSKTNFILFLTVKALWGGVSFDCGCCIPIWIREDNHSNQKLAVLKCIKIVSNNGSPSFHTTNDSSLVNDHNNIFKN